MKTAGDQEYEFSGPKTNNYDAEKLIFYMNDSTRDMIKKKKRPT